MKKLHTPNPMHAMQVNLEEYPIVVIHFHQELTAMEVHVAFNEIEDKIDSREGPFVFINITSGRVLSPDTRVALGERTEEFIRRFDSRYLGSALVVQSAISRMMIKGAMRLVKNSSKLKIVDSLEAGRALVNNWLAEAALNGE